MESLTAGWINSPLLSVVAALLGIWVLYLLVRLLWLKRELRLVLQEVETEFEGWKQRYERSIRRDAVRRSQAVTVGKVAEHLIPYLPHFEYNPKDARFVGSPVDFLVFDGLSVNDLQRIVFVEVKTGRSTLTAREQQVREAVLRQAVEWEEMRVG